MIVFHLTPVVKVLLVLLYVGLFYLVVKNFEGKLRNFMVVVMVFVGIVGYSININFADEKEIVRHQITNENNVMYERQVEPLQTTKKFDYEKELNSSGATFTKEQNQIHKQVVEGY